VTNTLFGVEKSAFVVVHIVINGTTVREFVNAFLQALLLRDIIPPHVGAVEVSTLPLNHRAS